MMRSRAIAEGYSSSRWPARRLCVLAKTYSHECGGMVLWIEEIYIAPEFRGNGLGKEFFDYLETEYKSVSRFRLELEPGNEKAERLYRRLGFEPLDYRQMVKEKKLP